MTDKEKKFPRGLIWGGVVLICIVLDQLTKYLAVHFLKPVDTFAIIQGVIHLTYTTNKGAAFGILQNQRWIFMVISVVAIVLLGYYLYTKKDDHPLLCTALSFVIGGGIGNMIDRICLGYVVDFIDFRLIHFAVFNVADSFVCIGCAMLFLWLFLFGTKEDKEITSTNASSGEGQS